MFGMDFHEIFSVIQSIVSLVGVLIILSGVIMCLFEYLRFAFSNNLMNADNINTLRLNLGRILVLGLEFIVAADLIHTTTTPDFYSVGILAGIVAIRTVLSYTLNREINDLSKTQSAV